jgi:trans-aconitate 2-methyltransferase
VTTSWDAAGYERVSDVQEGWAQAVLARLAPDGDETVLDAGCGSGRVTRRLLERLPRGRVVAVDASAEMVEHARASLPPGRATVLRADLTDLNLDEPVDAIFSNAVFHWVLDHERLFARLHAALRPGGRLVAQCGGAGNIAGLLAVVDAVAARAPYAEHLAGFARAWTFAGPEETEERLRAAGFDPARAWLEPSDVAPADPAGFLRTVPLRCHLDRLPADLRDGFVEAVLRGCGEPVRLDYVRLNIDARRRG